MQNEIEQVLKAQTAHTIPSGHELDQPTGD